MPAHGGLAPGPERYGGGAPPLQRIIEGLGAALGSAYDPTDTSGYLYVRLQAYARAIWAMWEQNTRLANQWDARRMTDFLERWEKIYQLSPQETDSLNVRRARVAAAQALAGFSNFAAIYNLCTILLGQCFVSIVITPSSSANVVTPAGWPMGAHPPIVGDPHSTIYWYSTVAHIAILVKQPATMDDGTFYTTVASIMPELDEILPAWVTFDWVRDGAGGAGFFLDDEHNLDNERFD